MFNLNESMRYYLYPYPTDMRKSFYTLSGIVTDSMKRDIHSGDVFIFINRYCTSMKILHMESGGLVIYHLKLESGSFPLPSFEENNPIHATNWQQLMLMVQGIELSACRQRKRWKYP